MIKLRHPNYDLSFKDFNKINKDREELINEIVMLCESITAGIKIKEKINNDRKERRNKPRDS